MTKRVFIILICMLIMLGTCASAESTVTSLKISLLKSEIFVGENTRIVATVLPSNAEDYELEYSSDDKDVAIAAIGVVIGKSEGYANITVKVKGTSISDTVRIKVTKKTENQETEKEDEEKTVLITKITPVDRYIYIDKYDEEKLDFDIFPSTATEKVKFKSSNENVVTVDEEGNVYGKKYGSSKITITSESGKVSGTITVYVDYDEDEYEEDKDLRKIEITHDDSVVTKTLEVMQSTSETLKIKSYPTAASKSVEWRSSNKRIATVSSSGVVTGERIGKCRIYATSTSNSSKTDYIEVSVTEYKRFPDKITVSTDKEAVIETGRMVKFNALISPVETTENKIYWYVYGGNATIDSYGNVTFYDKGKTRVVAYSQNHEVKGECEVDVKYSSDFFDKIGIAYNVAESKEILLNFTDTVNQQSAINNIFITDDEMGNNEVKQYEIEFADNKIKLKPKGAWRKGKMYIFVKSKICDINGNTLDKNIKYEVNIR